MHAKKLAGVVAAVIFAAIAFTAIRINLENARSEGYQEGLEYAFPAKPSCTEGQKVFYQADKEPVCVDIGTADKDPGTVSIVESDTFTFIDDPTPDCVYAMHKVGEDVFRKEVCDKSPHWITTLDASDRASRNYHTRFELRPSGPGILLDSRCYERILTVPGIRSAANYSHFRRYSVTVFKGDAFSWDEVEPAVVKAIEGCRISETDKTLKLPSSEELEWAPQAPIYRQSEPHWIGLTMMTIDAASDLKDAP